MNQVSDSDIEKIAQMARRMHGGAQGQTAMPEPYVDIVNAMHDELRALRIIAKLADEYLANGSHHDELTIALDRLAR